MKDFREMEQKLKQSGKADRVQAIADSRDGQALLGKLDTGRIERAVQSGDTDALRGILTEVLRTGEGRRIAKALEETMRG